MNFLSRNDVHASDHTPLSRTDDWTETVLAKLVEVGVLAATHQCTAVLDCGDFFNDKPPIRTTHALVAKIAAVHAAYPCPVYANVGNHDCPLSKLDFLDLSPLGTLFQTGVFRRCYNSHEGIFVENGMKVRVVGIPYHGPRYEWDRFRIKKGDEDFLIVMAHVLASPVLCNMFDQEDVVLYDNLTKWAPDVDVWHFGHWHADQGVVRLSNGAHVINVGSLTRGSLVQDMLYREPKVVLINLGPSGVRCTEIPITIKPPMEVFDVGQRVSEETRELMINLYSTSLKASLTNSTDSSVPLEERIKYQEGLMPKVRESALSILDRARHDK